MIFFETAQDKGTVMYERTGTLVREKFKEYLFPSVMTSLAMSLASVVDSMIVGNLLGGEALAAIGLSSPFIFCINLIYMLFGIGGMTSASIARGARKNETSNGIFSVTMAAGTAVMLLYVIIGQVLMTPVCNTLAAGDRRLAAMTAAYLRPLLFTGPFLMLSSGTALFMRVDGKPKASAMVVMIANAVNLLLDYTLIRFLHTGIMGAGLSTTLGYAAGTVLIAPYLFSPERRSFRFVKPGAGLLREVAGTGLPKGLTQFTSLGRSLVLNSLVMVRIGAVGMSVMTVLVNVLMICNIFVNGTCDAMLPIAGSLYGERDYYGVRRTAGSARNVLAAACTALTALLLVFPRVVGTLFGLGTAEELEVFVPALRLFAVYVPLYAAVVTLQNFYNTTGRRSLASVIAVSDGFVFVCLSALLFAQVSPNLMWLCYGAGSACTLLVILLLGARIRRREPVHGLLLLHTDNGQENVWDLTIDGTPEQAAGISERIIAFGKAHGGDEKLMNRVGVAVEEMAMATIHYAHKDAPGSIDIMLRLSDQELVLRFRDNGTDFNPAAYRADEEGEVLTDGIKLMMSLADHVDYARQMGFNTTVIRFKCPQLEGSGNTESMERIW